MDDDNSINGDMESIAAKLEGVDFIDPENPEENELRDEITQAKPGETGAEDPPTDENEDKPNETEKVEAETPIEPPASLRSDEKELFKSLPRPAQEIMQRLQQAQESHFTQRSTEYAQKIRATDDERQQYQTERARYGGELDRLHEMAAQLLPAKFQDIKSEADYLRLKATDPQRASEFEAFQGTLRMAAQQSSRLQEAKFNEHQNQEWQTLLSKTPGQDVAKAKEAVDTARKAAVEYYGFDPKEVNIVTDHRHIAILNDANAWRAHQANLKAAALKKTPATPTRVLRTTSTTGAANLADDKKAARLNRARNSDNTREQAQLIASVL